MEMLYLRIIILSVAVGIITGENPPTDVPFKRYCSAALYDAIRLICGSKYNSLAREYPESTGSYTYSEGGYKYPADSPFLSKLIDDADDYWSVPSRRGPIHECCRRPCGYAELKKYCAPER